MSLYHGSEASVKLLAKGKKPVTIEVTPLPNSVLTRTSHRAVYSPLGSMTEMASKAGNVVRTNPNRRKTTTRGPGKSRDLGRPKAPGD